MNAPPDGHGSTLPRPKRFLQRRLPQGPEKRTHATLRTDANRREVWNDQKRILLSGAYADLVLKIAPHGNVLDCMLIAIDSHDGEATTIATLDDNNWFLFETFRMAEVVFELLYRPAMATNPAHVFSFSINTGRLVGTVGAQSLGAPHFHLTLHDTTSDELIDNPAAVEAMNRHLGFHHISHARNSELCDTLRKIPEFGSAIFQEYLHRIDIPLPDKQNPFTPETAKMFRRLHDIGRDKLASLDSANLDTNHIVENRISIVTGIGERDGAFFLFISLNLPYGKGIGCVERIGIPSSDNTSSNLERYTDAHDYADTLNALRERFEKAIEQIRERLHLKKI